MKNFFKIATALVLMSNTMSAPISDSYKDVLSETIESALNDTDLIRSILSKNNNIVASSSWMERPFFGFSDSDKEKLKDQALSSYKYFIENTKSFDALSSSVSYEEDKLCTELAIVNTEETEEIEKYWVKKSYASSFSLEGVYSFFFNTEEESRSEYRYYHVKRDVKCVKEKRILRAVVRATPDFFKLNPQLLAGAIFTNYDKEKSEVLSILEDTNERLLKYLSSTEGNDNFTVDSKRYASAIERDRVRILDFTKGLPFNDDLRKHFLKNSLACSDANRVETETTEWLQSVREVIKSHLRLYKADYEIQDEFSFLLNTVEEIKANKNLAYKRLDYTGSNFESHPTPCASIVVDMRSELRRLSREFNRVLDKN
ncbi:putative exported protein [Halobacteriovorax marinus SJ]|uniref:Exported protein n=1 Tax=Halobacteriovorax marinus (strain ATCC BAA-682 / DSM 15412 / SJ) TaxID=862908 RepID=E1WYD4_HALMS|nr:hypothetical protein [Halobacteriovorax marinus]CBW25982.1 putative exported protein [Halobacteriovorax marinus SJ]